MHQSPTLAGEISTTSRQTNPKRNSSPSAGHFSGSELACELAYPNRSSRVQNPQHMHALQATQRQLKQSCSHSTRFAHQAKQSLPPNSTNKQVIKPRKSTVPCRRALYKFHFVRSLWQRSGRAELEEKLKIWGSQGEAQTGLRATAREDPSFSLGRKDNNECECGRQESRKHLIYNANSNLPFDCRIRSHQGYSCTFISKTPTTSPHSPHDSPCPPKSKTCHFPPFASPQ